MTRGAYYNEVDPYAAAWLRNLISVGLIASGDVDERSNADVRAADLRGYVQCHFFAGIGIWSAALRQAGWPDDRPVWTGSCPCQPLSAAGKGLGTGDSRHLWPVWFELIRECRPVTIFGEQVASADGLAWLDLVQSDLENAAYASGAVDLCAAGFGAPHIRQRLWFVAYPDGGDAGAEGLQRGRQHGLEPEDGRADRVADAGHGQRRDAREFPGAPGADEIATPGEGRDGLARPAAHRRPARDMADAPVSGRPAQPERPAGEDGRTPQESRRLRDAGDMGDADATRPQRRGLRSGEGPGECAARPSGPDGRAPGPVNGFWRDAEWIACTDGKARPVEAGTFPLVDGDKGRVGKLRAYGNAICQEVAAEFVAAYLDMTG